LPLVPNHVDLGVAGDGLERNMGDALTDEAVADTPAYRLRAGRGAGDFGFLNLPFSGIGQEVKRITRAHNASTR
jgi:hypothetical protein